MKQFTAWEYGVVKWASSKTNPQTETSLKYISIKSDVTMYLTTLFFARTSLGKHGSDSEDGTYTKAYASNILVRPCEVRRRLHR